MTNLFASQIVLKGDTQMRTIMRLVVVGVSLLAWLPCAQAQGLHRTVLGRGTSPGPNRSVPVREASDVVQVTVTLDAGAVGPWHYHPGPAIIIVEKGEFTLTQDDSNCSTATYVAQEGNHPVVWEDAFNIHRPANLSGAETTIFITFLDIPSDSPDMIAADPQVCNQNSASLSAKAKAVASARPVPHQMQDAYPQRSSDQPTMHIRKEIASIVMPLREKSKTKESMK